MNALHEIAGAILARLPFAGCLIIGGNLHAVTFGRRCVWASHRRFPL